MRCMRLVLTAAALCLAAPQAFAQGLVAEVQNSRWDTRYDTVGGDHIRAIVTFNGRSGDYQVLDDRGNAVDRGQLSNIGYFPGAGGGALITGKWSMDGQRGFFQMNVDARSPSSIHGGWNFDNVSRGGGRWSGFRIRNTGGGNVGSGSNGNGGSGASGGRVVYGHWHHYVGKDYYYRTCSFPAGGYQYLLWYPEKPGWVYWYNPEARVIWCACPTVRNAKWGDDIRNGDDLFLLATTKSRQVNDCVFPDAGNDGANFTKGRAKDNNGSTVDLGCPPPDLP